MRRAAVARAGTTSARSFAARQMIRVHDQPARLSLARSLSLSLCLNVTGEAG